MTRICCTNADLTAARLLLCSLSSWLRLESAELKEEIGLIYHQALRRLDVGNHPVLYWSLTHHNNVFHLCRDKFMIHVVPCSTINMPTTFDKVHNLLNPKSYALTQFINILYSLNSEKQNFRARWSQQCWIWYKTYSAICFSKLDIYVGFGYMIYEANFISQWKNSTIKQVW